MVVGNREVDNSAGPALGLVARLLYRAVADVPDDAIHVPHARDAQADAFDSSGDAADVNDVSHPVLVLEHHEYPGQEIPDQLLRTEPDRHAENAGAGKHRREIQPHVAGDDQ